MSASLSKLRTKGEEDAESTRWHINPLLHLFRPGSCSKTHLFDAPPTLGDSWSSSGKTCDGRQLSTTRFLSFATAGNTIELSRWCFFLEGKAEPAVYFEVNNYECDLGHWADTGEWTNPENAGCYLQSFAD